jgi:hypothetical protein
LENVGLIRREARSGKYGGSSTNAYHFDGLITKVTPYANKALAERKANVAKRAMSPETRAPGPVQMRLVKK